MIKSLWGDEFNIEETPVKNKNLISKINKPKPTKTLEQNLKSKVLPLEDRLNLINTNVIKILGKQKENTLIIRDRITLTDYINKSIINGIISIDTETNNSVDPLTCKLMGPCIYTPGEKQAYIPLNHVNNETGVRLENQLTEQDIAEEFKRLVSSDIKIIFHNAKFDYQVIKCTCDVALPIYWDTMIAARLLDENEPSAGLKQQYIDKIDSSQEKYSIDHLFENVEYAQVDPDIFALYAATDAMMTYKLYLWQLERFKDPELQGVYNVYINTEVPLISVIAKMELRGVNFDLNYASKLHNKYHKQLIDCDLKIQDELNNIKDKIDKWRLTLDANDKIKKYCEVKKLNDPDIEEKFPYQDANGRYKLSKSKTEQLTEPMNLDSPTQLAIILYDILKSPTVNKEKPRSTGVDELKQLAEKTQQPLCKLILEKRGIAKLINTFVDKLPNDVNKSDGKIHCQINQMGTDTGRMSSSKPNTQQLPRDVKDIRAMFCAEKGKMLIGADFSQLEVKTSVFCSKDTDMLRAYQEGKDLYSVIASLAYDLPYDQCSEFYPEGTELEIEGKKIICGHKTHTNKSGKAIRQSAKPLLIGSIYQRGINSIAEQIHKTREEAQVIMDKFYKGFPIITKWMEDSKQFTLKHGYMDNAVGRRRRLPDALLPRYSIKPKDDSTLKSFNPFLNCTNKLNDDIVKKYQTKLDNIKTRREYENIQREALNEDIEIHDNNGKIQECLRQCVNFQAQSLGADIVKMAMIAIDKDEILNNLGFGLLLTIHDELIGEAPEENAEQAAERLTQIMLETPLTFGMTTPMAADSYIVKNWYEDEITTSLLDTFSKSTKNGMSESEALNLLYEEHPDLEPKSIYNTIIKGERLII